MEPLFDTWTDRSGPVLWLKNELTPAALRAQGKRGFCGAEFEFPTCPAFTRGVLQAVQNGLFGFTLPGPAYKERVQWWMKTVRSFAMDPDWLVTTHGTVFSLATLIRLLCSEQDAILTMPPGYNRYEQAASRLGHRTVKVPLLPENGGYTVDLPALEQAMTRESVRILVLTNPNNPTGTVFSRETLREMVRLAEEHNAVIFSDEIFAEVVFDGTTVPCLAAEFPTSAHVISCTGLGKLFSLTGVNHANLLIPDASLRERYLAQRDRDHYGSLDPLVHAGLLTAFTPEGVQWTKELCLYIQENAQLVAESLPELLPGVAVTRPRGTYVLWVNFQNTGLSPDRLNKLLLESGFIGDPGPEYGGDEWEMRYSLATPREGLRQALASLKQLLTSDEKGNESI